MQLSWAIMKPGNPREGGARAKPGNQLVFL